MVSRERARASRREYSRKRINRASPRETDLDGMPNGEIDVSRDVYDRHDDRVDPNANGAYPPRESAGRDLSRRDGVESEGPIQFTGFRKTKRF